jgi:predicted GNAT superfamily acetyltransferase
VLASDAIRVKDQPPVEFRAAPPHEGGYLVRELRSPDAFADVFALEQRVWGLTSGDDAVPVHVMVATVHCGALVLGAYDTTGALVGFAYSFLGRRHGELLHWSHILGVLPEHRGRGVARQLKFAQRERVLAQGLDLMAWTFDPLQVENAHFNFAVLGARSAEYLRDVYGASESPLHRGVATDRLVVEWRLEAAAVRERAAGRASAAQETGQGAPEVWLNGVRPVGGHWLAWADGSGAAAGALQAGLRIPPAFTAMLRDAPELAQEWRARTRDAFETSLARGFVVQRFVRDGERGGFYLLGRGR